MKIAFFSDAYLDLPGGITSSINAQKAALEADGHEVKVFSTAYPKNAQTIQNLADQQIFPVPSCRIFMRGLTPVARNPRYLENWLLKAHPELKTFDIFYIHYEAGLSIAAIGLARQLGIPVVQVMHGREDMGEANIVPFGFRTPVAMVLNRSHAHYLPHDTPLYRDDYLAETFAKAKMWELMVAEANAADLVLTPSKHFRQKLLRYGVERPIKVFPNGLADRNFPVHIMPKILHSGDPLRLIWHSRLSAEKRLLPFLEALTLFEKPFHLDVFGEGPDALLARTFARHYRLPVHFYGPVSFADLKPYLASAHLDLLPSYNFDTFGMILIEAHAFGTPTLICDPDLAETLPSDTFLLTKNPSPEAIAVELNHLVSHPDHLEKMSRKLLKTRENVLISRRIKTLERYFEELISKN